MEDHVLYEKKDSMCLRFLFLALDCVFFNVIMRPQIGPSGVGLTRLRLPFIEPAPHGDWIVTDALLPDSDRRETLPSELLKVA